MLRLRNVLILVTGAVVIYLIIPAERKTRVRGKLREVRNAFVMALALYWVYMIVLAIVRHFSD